MRSAAEERCRGARRAANVTLASPSDASPAPSPSPARVARCEPPSHSTASRSGYSTGRSNPMNRSPRSHDAPTSSSSTNSTYEPLFQVRDLSLSQLEYRRAPSLAQTPTRKFSEGFVLVGSRPGSCGDHWMFGLVPKFGTWITCFVPATREPHHTERRDFDRNINCI